MKTRCGTALIVAGLVGAGAAGAGAEIIKPLVDPSTGQHSGWEAVIFDPQHVDLITDAVDIQGGQVVLEKFADFRGVDPFTGAPEAINILFRQVLADAQSVSRFVITDEVISNNTGLDWVDFKNILTNNGVATFNTGLSADFDIAPFTSREYADGDTIARFFDGTIAAGQVWTPGRVQGGLVWDVNLQQDTPVSFTLKELAAVPAPGAMALLGMAGLVAARRRR